MKKKIVLLAVLFMSLFVAAQAQERDRQDLKITTPAITVETQIGAFAPLYTDALSMGYAPSISAKVRYFLNSQLALRFRTGIVSATSSQDYVPDDDYEEIALSVKSNTTSMGIFNFGFEQHFTGTKRLSPYAGAEIGLSYAVEKSSIVSDNDNYVKRSDPFMGPIGTLFAGTDIYLLENLYCGVEIGASLEALYSLPSTLKIKTNGHVVSTTSENSSSVTVFNVGLAPVFRIGWKF
ncbi:MAG: hypothetical protein LBR51_03180 [Bacteroidales bacterium]|jgi:hypothetical protein|nr:hypothetical protein [Bacteroidales bacterium]